MAVSIVLLVGGGGVFIEVAAERLTAGGAGWLVQSLKSAVWSPPQLAQQAGDEEQQPGVALRLPPLGQVGLGMGGLGRYG